MDVYFEAGAKRVFACSLEWPGWCRSAKTEGDALAALADYAPRYDAVARQAGIAFPAMGQITFQVVERLEGSKGYTDFGVPGGIPERDWEPLESEEAARQTGLVRASWVVFDQIAAGAPAELRKGPRGGGRDRDKVIDHVLGAEVAYARKLGLKYRQPAHDDTLAIATLREAIIAALVHPSDVSEGTAKRWPPRYAARRIAWHVLDHAWEIEDRSV